MDYLKEFTKTFKNIDYGRCNFDKFRDFCTMASISLANPFYRSEELEKQYMQIANSYKPKDLEGIAKLFALTAQALTENPNQDFLGTCFMRNDMGNKHNGQFFTPYHICELMATLSLGDTLPAKGYHCMNEPCVGAGAIVIGMRNAIVQKGWNPSTSMLAVATDIDELSFRMSYIQLSLLGVPAVINHGNTLTFEVWQTLYTPIYFLCGWHERLANEARIKEMLTFMSEIESPYEAEPKTEPEIIEKPSKIIELPQISKEVKQQQLSLF